MVVPCGEWLFTQEVRSAKHWRKGKDVNGIINVDVLKGVAGMSSYVVVGERLHSICNVTAPLLSTLWSGGVSGNSVFGAWLHRFGEL